MKPQVEVLILAGGLYILFQGILKKDWRPTGLTIAPATLFIAYSVYFFTQGLSIFSLLNSYIHISDIMPSICAQMLNPWYPLAYLLTEPGSLVYNESDLQPLFGPFVIRHAAIALTISYLTYYAFRLTKHFDPASAESTQHTWLQLMAFSSLILPMLMTSAHENHAFLATILLVLLTALKPSNTHLMTLHAFMLLQCTNLLGLYGVGYNSFTSNYLRGITSLWTPEAMLIASILSTTTFLILIQYFFLRLRPNDQNLHTLNASLPSSDILLFFSLIYALTLYSN